MFQNTNIYYNLKKSKPIYVESFKISIPYSGKNRLSDTLIDTVIFTVC